MITLTQEQWGVAFRNGDGTFDLMRICETREDACHEMLDAVKMSEDVMIVEIMPVSIHFGEIPERAQ